MAPAPANCARDLPEPPEEPGCRVYPRLEGLRYIMASACCNRCRAYGPPLADQLARLPYSALQSIVRKFNPAGCATTEDALHE